MLGGSTIDAVLHCREQRCTCGRLSPSPATYRCTQLAGWTVSMVLPCKEWMENAGYKSAIAKWNTSFVSLVVRRRHWNRHCYILVPVDPLPSLPVSEPSCGVTGIERFLVSRRNCYWKGVVAFFVIVHVHELTNLFEPPWHEKWRNTAKRKEKESGRKWERDLHQGKRIKGDPHQGNGKEIHIKEMEGDPHQGNGKETHVKNSRGIRKPTSRKGKGDPCQGSGKGQLESKEWDTRPDNYCPLQNGHALICQ